VSNEANFAKRAVGTVLRNVVTHFLRKTNSHFLDVPFRVLLVSTREEEHDFREEEGNIILKKSHVV
jgi:hypothetical protein